MVINWNMTEHYVACLYRATLRCHQARGPRGKHKWNIQPTSQSVRAEVEWTYSYECVMWCRQDTPRTVVLYDLLQRFINTSAATPTPAESLLSLYIDYLNQRFTNEKLTAVSGHEMYRVIFTFVRLYLVGRRTLGSHYLCIIWGQ